MHIQQTKDDSLATGGPQYYLHNVALHIKEFLRKRGACPVVLQTPLVNPPDHVDILELSALAEYLRG